MVEIARSPVTGPPAGSHVGSSPCRSLTYRKHEPFSALLAAGKQPGRPAPVDEAAAGPVAAAGSRVSPSQAPLEGASESLAPEPEAGGGGPLDPAAWLALINPSGGPELPLAPGAIAAPPSPAGSPELAALLERWVKRVAVGGDARRGVARLDIGTGRLAGSEVVVITEAGHVSVELNLAAGQAEPGLQERLAQRLTQRGFESEVVVR